MKTKNTKLGATASRLQKPSFKDPRLLFGILLILVSILSVSLVLRAGNKSESYYAAKTDIKIGQKISAEDLTVVEAKFDESQKSKYSLTTENLEGRYATSLINAGEVITISDISEHFADPRREVTLTVESGIAAALDSGERVDIWVSEKKPNSQTFEEPHVVMVSAEVVSKNSEESLIGGTGKTSVVLRVAPDSLSSILAAVNNEAKINLIPTNFVTVQG